MVNIPTSEQFIESFGMLNSAVMIDFAKLHVKAALETAAGKAKIKSEIVKAHGWNFEDYEEKVVDRNSILSAYPLTNIK